MSNDTKPRPLLAAVVTVLIIPCVVIWMAFLIVLLVVLWPILPIAVFVQQLQKSRKPMLV